MFGRLYEIGKRVESPPPEKNKTWSCFLGAKVAQVDEKGEMKQKMMEYLFKSYQNVETQERVHKKVRKKF